MDNLPGSEIGQSIEPLVMLKCSTLAATEKRATSDNLLQEVDVGKTSALEELSVGIQIFVVRNYTPTLPRSISNVRFSKMWMLHSISEDQLGDKHGLPLRTSLEGR
jgi:hypothetical protein